MVRFSNQEYFDILGVFHRANGNAALAARIYQESYPASTFYSIIDDI